MDEQDRPTEERAAEGCPDDGCAAEGCERAVWDGELCGRHARQQRHADGRPGPAPHPCAVPGCVRTAVTRGWCHGHYVRWYRTGDVRAEVPLVRPEHEPCRVEGCPRGSRSGGWCRVHSGRRERHGDPTGGGPERATGAGGSLSHGYWKVPVPEDERHLVPPGRTVELEHRLAMARRLGRPLERDEVVHHLNGDRLDNRDENLELWNTAQPKGQRVADKLAHAYALLARYDPDAARVLGLGPAAETTKAPHPGGGGPVDVPPNGFEPSLPP